VIAPTRRDTAVRRVKELARIANDAAERLLGLRHVLDVGRHAVQEFQGGEFAAGVGERHRFNAAC
jgi:hypothetical protein